jgi:hypothetical protein
VKKADNATIGKRVSVIYTLILQGWHSADIVRSLSEQWELTGRQIENYIAKARKLIEKSADERREAAFERHLAARALLYKTTKDERLKLKILQDEAKMMGLYPVKKREYEVEVEISDRERLDRLMELSDAARERRSKKAN